MDMNYDKIRVLSARFAFPSIGAAKTFVNLFRQKGGQCSMPSKITYSNFSQPIYLSWVEFSDGRFRPLEVVHEHSLNSEACSIRTNEGEVPFISFREAMARLGFNGADMHMVFSNYYEEREAILLSSRRGSSRRGWEFAHKLVYGVDPIEQPRAESPATTGIDVPVNPFSQASSLFLLKRRKSRR